MRRSQRHPRAEQTWRRAIEGSIVVVKGKETLALLAGDDKDKEREHKLRSCLKCCRLVNFRLVCAKVLSRCPGVGIDHSSDLRRFVLGT